MFEERPAKPPAPPKKLHHGQVFAPTRKKDTNCVDNNPYITKFYKLSKWQPSFIDVFAGKLDYPNYNFINKNVIRFIMYITKGPTKTNEIIEFTNWENVRNFAVKIINY